MRRILLDTHVFLWLTRSPGLLPATWRMTFGSSETELSLSAASAWEIALKSQLGKLKLPAPPGEYVRTRCAALGIGELPVTVAHAGTVTALPMHHRDPFDRMLVAQAVYERLTIATLDPVIPRYAVKCLPVASAASIETAKKARPRKRAAAR